MSRNSFGDIDDSIWEAIIALDEAFDIGFDFKRFNQDILTLDIRNHVVEELKEIQKQLNNEKFLDDVGEMYNVHYPIKMDDGEVVLELETATDNGALMSVYLEEDSDMSWLDQLKAYAESFDVDKEVDVARVSESYRNKFSINECLLDIETYIEDVQNWIQNHEENLDHDKDKNVKKKSAITHELEM